MAGASPGHSDLRGIGDDLRDRGRYAEAARAYAAYLAHHPGNFGIWVQNGNCLKDAGDYDRARAAYETALTLRDDSPDLFVQFGHLMNLQGMKSKARVYHQRALHLDPSHAPALEALNAMSAFALDRRRDEAPRTWPFPARALDISDLLLFLMQNTRVTGIQRVQCCLLVELLRNGRAANVKPVLYDSAVNELRTVDPTATLALMQLLGLSDVSRDLIRNQVREICASSLPAALKRDDALVIMGAYWNLESYPNLLLNLRRKGVLVGVYIYDLIPITHPSFFTETTRADYSERFHEVMSLVDFAFTISEHTAREASMVIESALKRKLPIIPVPLAHELPKTSGASASETFLASLPEKYALCVGTLEIRKNHDLLLSVWEKLVRERGGEVPHLILAGKWGWRIEAFRDRLLASDFVGGKIIVMNNLADAELEILYRGCMVTFFPSFVEGWGLPVGESLAHGKPCIASNSSSIPEVGGDFVRYIDPGDPVSAAVEIERALFDEDGLRQWTRRVADGFVVRRWADVAVDFLAKLDAVDSRCRATAIGNWAFLSAGKVHELSRGSHVPGHEILQSLVTQSVCVEGWLPPDEVGRQAAGSEATIVIPTTCEAASSVIVWLRLQLCDASDAGGVIVEDNLGHALAIGGGSAVPRWLAFETAADADGAVNLVLRRRGSAATSPRAFFGVSALAYHRAADGDSRARLEHVLASRGESLAPPSIPPRATLASPPRRMARREAGNWRALGRLARRILS